MSSRYLLLLLAGCAREEESSWFIDVCPVPGSHEPWTSSETARWSAVPMASGSLLDEFDTLTSGVPITNTDATWKTATDETSSISISVQMTPVPPVEAVVWSFDEAGVTEQDLEDWMPTDVSAVPEDWPACDMAVVTGVVEGTFQRSDVTWPFEGELTNGSRGSIFTLTFDVDVEEGGGTLSVRLDAAQGIVGVTWTDPEGQFVGGTLSDAEASSQ